MKATLQVAWQRPSRKKATSRVACPVVTTWVLITVRNGFHRSKKTKPANITLNRLYH